LGRLHAASSNGSPGQRQQRRALLGGQHPRRGTALQHPRPALARDVGAPAHRVGGHRLQLSRLSLTSGFEFFGAPSGGLMGVEELLLELGGSSGDRRGVGGADLA